MGGATEKGDGAESDRSDRGLTSSWWSYEYNIVAQFIYIFMYESWSSSKHRPKFDRINSIDSPEPVLI